MTSVAFNISVINDTILEGNESFKLSIMESSLPFRVYCDYPCMTDVIIVDTSGESLIMWYMIMFALSLCH